MGNREFAFKLLNQAVQAANNKSKPSNLSTAYQLFASACVADPTWGDAHYIFGNNAFDLKKYDTAVAAYRRALFCELNNETRAMCMLNLAWTFFNQGKTQLALQMNTEAGKIKPDLVHYWSHKSLLHTMFGETALAVTTAEKAIFYAEKELAAGPSATMIGSAAIGNRDQAFLDQQLLDANIALAFGLLFDGQYERGFKQFEYRFPWRLHSYLQYPYPKWQGEMGMTVFLSADQGLGDTLSFARFAEVVCKRSKYVHAYIQPPLMRVFINALGHIPNLNFIPFGNAYPEADAWTTFVSLPYALGLSDEQVRSAVQIPAPRHQLPTTWMVPDVKLHVGIAWAGSPLNDIDQHRNIPIERFLDLYQVPGIQLYSLQVGERVREMVESGAVSLVRDLSTYINDITDTVAILRNLDLVICCESALAHICALVGVECWIPYSWRGRDYRIGATGEKLLWTPKHRIFKMKPDNDWGPVFDQVIARLEEKVHGARQEARERSKVVRSAKLR